MNSTYKEMVRIKKEIEKIELEIIEARIKCKKQRFLILLK